MISRGSPAGVKSALQRCRPVLIGFIVLVFAFSIAAQKRFTLTIDNIMRGPELVGYEPSAPRWSGDSRKIYFEWKQAADPVLKPMSTYVVNRDGSELRKLTEEEAKLAPPAIGDRSRDKTKTVFIHEGDIFLYDHTSGSTRQITKTADIEANQHFTRDGKRVWFTRSNNLYVLSLQDGLLEELTDIRSPTAGPQEPAPDGGGLGTGQAQRGSGVAARSNAEPQKGTDSQEFVKKEERELLDVVNQRATLREEEEARKKRDNPRKPMTLQPRQQANVARALTR